MAAPNALQLLSPTALPAGEAAKIFAPADAAWRIENLELTPEGTLRTALGPAHYEPNRGEGYPSAYTGQPFSIFHAGLLGGIGDTLLARFNGTIYIHRGESRTFSPLVTGLSYEGRPAWPDQYVVLHGRIIWTNGVDRAQVIAHDGLAAPLGFDSKPGAPSAIGPAAVPEGDRGTYFANSRGYSWPGRIGTVGDIVSDAIGKVRTGHWFYRLQLEDIFGNLSPLSSPSAAISVNSQRANDTYDVRVDDLTRQFAVWADPGNTPAHAVAMRVLRSPDAVFNPPGPRLVYRSPTARPVLCPDLFSDAELGREVKDNVVVPVFRVMTAHKGTLVIGNTLQDPAIVRRSEPGFAGTFPVDEWVYPDSGGAAVTGLASHGGRLLAFTESSVYDLSDFRRPVALAQGVGCVAPRSIASLPDGTLVWLGRDGFYALSDRGVVARVSDAIHRLISDGLSRGRMRMAVAARDHRSGEYRCAVTPAGLHGNRLLLCFDGQNWRRRSFAVDIADICATDDYRRYTLVAGRDTANSQNGVFVLDHEYAAYAPPSRVCRYRSGWFKLEGAGNVPADVRELYVGLVDGSNADVTVEFYRDGSWAPVSTVTTVRAVGPESWGGTNSRIVTDIAGSAVIGTSLVHQRRLFWRRVPAAMQNCATWAFEVRATYPTTRYELAAFAFDVGVSTSGNAKSRTPQHADVS